MWIAMAVLSAFFAGVTSILAKCGIKKTDSEVATALRTIVVLAFAWIMVFVVGSAGTITQIGTKSLIFLILSGMSTGISWLCYFKALFIGNVNKVVPVDKSSTILTVLLAIVVFGETKNLWVKLVCTALLAVGIFLMIEKKPEPTDATDTDKTETEQNSTVHGEQTTVADGEVAQSDVANPPEQTQTVKSATKTSMAWLPYAIASAVFAALTSIFAKVGIENVESNLGTAIRTGVVLVMAWLVVLVKGKQSQLKHIEKGELLFIALSGVATGASWLCYYYAIQNGIVSVVVPIDKMSILVSIIFSAIVFKEKLSKKALVGLIIMLAATIAMALFT